MAAAYVNSSAGVVATGSGGNLSVNVGYPASLVANRLLVIFVGAFSAGGALSLTFGSAPAGWTLITSLSSSGVGQAAFWKLATGSESGTVTITATYSGGSIQRIAAEMAQFSGNATTTPVYAAATNTGSSTSAAPASVTTTAAANLAVYSIFTIANSASGTTGIAANTGETGGDYTETITDYNPVGATYSCLEIQTAAMAAAGTISGGTSTISQTGAWRVINFAINALGGTANTLALAAASISVSPAALTLKIGRKLVQSPASVTASASAIGTKTNRRVSLGSASIAVAATARALSRGYRQALSPASVTVNASTFGLSYAPGSGAYSLVLSPASVAVVPTALALRLGHHTTLSPAVIAVAASTLGTKVERKLGLAAASVSVVPAAIGSGAATARFLVLGPAVVGINASALGLKGTHTLGLGAVSIAVNPSALGLVASIATNYTLGLETANVALTPTDIDFTYTPGPEPAPTPTPTIPEPGAGGGGGIYSPPHRGRQRRLKAERLSKDERLKLLRRLAGLAPKDAAPAIVDAVRSAAEAIADAESLAMLDIPVRQKNDALDAMNDRLMALKEAVMRDKLARRRSVPDRDEDLMLLLS